MSKYEVMFLLDPTEVKVNEGIASIRQFVEDSSGKLLKEENMGMKRPAYPVKKREMVHYFMIQANLDPERMQPLDEMVRVSESILKHMPIRLDQEAS